MSLKRLLFISIFMALVVVGLSHGRLIQAETEPDPEFWSFNHITNDRLTAVASGDDGCPAVAQDEANYSFVLPVTTALRKDMLAALAAGGQSAVAFKTDIAFQTEGDGSAEYQAEFALIFDDSSGSETILETRQVERVANDPDTMTEFYVWTFTEELL
ncbi:MAG: hypothetical protein JSW55_16490, partial [Chloroflexota bacterium]